MIPINQQCVRFKSECNVLFKAGWPNREISILRSSSQKSQPDEKKMAPHFAQQIQNRCTDFRACGQSGEKQPMEYDLQMPDEDNVNLAGSACVPTFA